LTQPSIGEIDGLPALVVLEGGWRDEYANVIEAHGLAVLSIMVRGSDLSFLSRVPSLRGLVLNAGEVRDLSSVQALPRLETLTLNTPSKPRLELDFGAFPLLEKLRLYWNPGFESLFSARRLESLFLFGPPDADLGRFAALSGLKRLELSQGRKLVSTAGVPPVEFLGLYQQGALEELVLPASLRVLAVESCKKLTSLDAVSGLSLSRLKVANCGDIESLAPLRGMSSLEEFLAWESTRVLDGDLSVLLDLPRLRLIGMQDRTSYTPRVKEIEAALSARGAP
jgi:internalin A